MRVVISGSKVAALLTVLFYGLAWSLLSGVLAAALDLTITRVYAMAVVGGLFGLYQGISIYIDED